MSCVRESDPPNPPDLESERPPDVVRMTVGVDEELVYVELRAGDPVFGTVTIVAFQPEEAIDLGERLKIAGEEALKNIRFTDAMPSDPPEIV